MEQRQYSFSRLDLYERCPWAYTQTVYLEKIPRAGNEARETGQLLHQLVADYLGRLILNNSPTDWEWAQEAAPKDALADVSEMWERFYNTFTLPPGLEAPGVENRLAFDRKWHPVKFDSKRAYFRMVIDFHFRQNGLGVIVDWKTNRQVPQTVTKDPAAQDLWLGLETSSL